MTSKTVVVVPRRTVTVSLPPKLAKRVDRAAKAEGQTRSELFRQALQQYLAASERWNRIFEYGEQVSARTGVTDLDVLRAIEEERHVG
jgi:metal-responsive CopG/Arc/MetJ family transcriptional regulator